MWEQTAVKMVRNGKATLEGGSMLLLWALCSAFSYRVMQCPTAGSTTGFRGKGEWISVLGNSLVLQVRLTGFVAAELV